METIINQSEAVNVPYCRDQEQVYQKLVKIGQGTFGEVFKARNRKTGQEVALKKILMENEHEGFPITALREIKILKKIRPLCNNVVKLLEVCKTKPTPFNQYKTSICMVFEFCHHDLAGMLNNRNISFSLGEIKGAMKQMLHGLFFLHNNKMLHRDMKAANILLNKDGVLKLADFGLARAMKQDNKNYTNRVVTLWYRPPELLLGERDYDTTIDMWGAGCIMAEMWTRIPILQGRNEQHQLALISHLCGSISTAVWPQVRTLKLYESIELPQGQRRILKTKLKPYVKDNNALDLLDVLLSLDPKHRLSADRALDHDFFWRDPLPCDLKSLMKKQTSSNFDLTVSRAKAQQPPEKKRRVEIDQNHDRVF